MIAQHTFDLPEAYFKLPFSEKKNPVEK